MDLKGRLGVTAGIVVVAGVVAALTLYLTGDGDPNTGGPGGTARTPGTSLVDPVNGVTVTWDTVEGTPSCAYDAATRTVVARLTVDGEATKDMTLAVTVSAYADENTSDLVNAVTQLVHADRGTVQEKVRITIPVDRPTHRGEDGGTACRLRVDDET